MRHGIVCSLAVALLCACQPSAGAPATAATMDTRGKVQSTPSAGLVRRQSQPMTLRELSRIVGATCDNPDTGEGCFGGDYDVELLPDCGSHGLFAVVRAPKGALLIDKAPPDDSVRRAMLSQGQFVCIEAIARAGASASYYYVVAVNEPMPENHGHYKTEWLAPHNEQPCLMVSKGRFEGCCAAGWTDEEGLSVLPKK